MRTIFTIIALSVFTTTLDAQTIAKFDIKMPEDAIDGSVPRSIDLDSITRLPASGISLVERHGNNIVEIPCQVTNGKPRRLYWLIPAGNGVGAVRRFELVKKPAKPASKMEAPQKDGALTIRAGNKNLLRYQFGTVYPPKGVDSAFKRNAFIHPLWSPHGQVLTRIQPPDHYHHYGIWNPWTHVLYKNDTVDFWNIGGKKGTVRFAGFAAVNEGPVFAGFDARHDHVVFRNGGEEVALKEIQSVRVYQPGPDADYYIADIDIKMNCATSNPVLLLEYRYGGLGWRTTEVWDRNNSEVITSEGKTRRDADGSKATWCIVQGALDNDYGGVVMMSHPSNYNHPEPLRIWPENMNNRGDMFANFSPTKDKNWLLEPGKTYTLKYRLLVFNGHFTKEKAEAAWQQFANITPINIR